MEKDYECEQVPVIINIPDNTVKLSVKATVMEKDDSLVEAETTMTTAEVMDARIRGEEWEFENVKYQLTDLGRQMVENEESN